MSAATVINTRKMRYSGDALAAMRSSTSQPHANVAVSNKATVAFEKAITKGELQKRLHKSCPPYAGAMRKIGPYPLTTRLASWVVNAFAAYKPSPEAIDLIRPFADEFHDLLEKERANGMGLHDLDPIELTYQISLVVGAALLLAATEQGNVANLQVELHSSRVARDDHLAPWGKLLTGLDCEPPIIAQFPIYLMMCQSFGLESTSCREDYVYSLLTGIDWVKGQNAFSERFQKFEDRARAAVPALDDKISGRDRSFWRVPLAYRAAINSCENTRPFTFPKTAAIHHALDVDLVIAVRAFDTIGSAYMCSDGAAFLDDAGMDSLIGSAVPNDVLDLHNDIKTGGDPHLVTLALP